jgi:NAD(P)H-hydrate epimerase
MGLTIYLTRAQVREIDRRSIEEFHIPGIVLMENAARAAAEEAMRFLTGNERPFSALILCGGGNNGGDGLAIARHLHNRGVQVQIGLTIDPARYQGDALINWNIVRAMRLPAGAISPIEIAMTQAHLIIDAIFGTGLEHPPRLPFAEIAAAVRQAQKPVLAIDVPSGLDCDTGQPLGDCIAATRTVTFVAPKAGFANLEAKKWTGEVVVGNIGCPIELLDNASFAQPPRAQ